MRPLIPVPTKGEKLRATWGTQVANRVNELCAMAPAGVLHREGFGGIGDQPLPQNLRVRPSNGAVPGCWRLSVDVDEGNEGEGTSTATLTLVDCYYNVGGVTKFVASIDVSADADATGFLCAVFGANQEKGVSAEMYDDMEALNEAQENMTKYIVPLYQLDAGAIVLDMRNAQQVQVFEGTL